MSRITYQARAVRHYAEHSVDTASPVRLVIMLYQRLARDLRQALAALEGRDLLAVNSLLQHAQEIVAELRASLDTTAWDAGDDLGALYDYLYDELVAANVAKDARRVHAILGMVEPLLAAWLEAAANVAGEGEVAV